MSRPLLSDAELRRLVSVACHGAGAAERWAARDRLEDEAKIRGVHLRVIFQQIGASIPAYMASRPISRESAL